MSQHPTPSSLERDRILNAIENKESSFIDTAFNALSTLEPGEYSGEDIRVKLSNMGIAPQHHNAWGALIRKGILSGLLVDTGRTTKMKTKSSHARKTTIYALLPNLKEKGIEF